MTIIGVIYNKITHLVVRTRKIEHILINVHVIKKQKIAWKMI